MNSLSVVIVAYNEEALIGETLQATLRVLEDMKVDYEVIAVNDGSTDKTGAIIASFASRNSRVKPLVHPQNLGMGMAIKDGYRAVQKNLVCFLPADGQISPTVLKQLYNAMEDVDFITTIYAQRPDNFFRFVISRVLRIMTRLLLGPFPRLEGTYMFRRKIFETVQLSSDSFLLNLEFVLRAARQGYRYKQMIIPYLPRREGQSKVANMRNISRVFKEMLKLRAQLRAGRVARILPS